MLTPPMPHRSTLRRHGACLRWLLLGVVAGAGVGCKSEGSGSKAPAQPITLEDIDAELGRNERALAQAGIVVPSAPSDFAEPPPEPEPTLPPEPTLEPTPEPGPTPVEVQPDAPPPSTPTSSTDTDSYAMAGEDDDAPELTARRDEREEAKSAESAEKLRGKRRRGGRRRFGSRKAKSSKAEREPSRCDRVCDLADSTCSLAGHVCGLADRHPTEPRYRESCRRAERQCDAAIEACGRCR